MEDKRIIKNNKEEFILFKKYYESFTKSYVSFCISIIISGGTIFTLINNIFNLSIVGFIFL